MSDEWSTLRLPEFYRRLAQILALPSPEADWEGLKRRADELSAMVGWAPGPIDPTGQASALSETLEAQLASLYQATRHAPVAELYGALDGLRAAISAHDADLDPEAEGDEGEAW